MSETTPTPAAECDVCGKTHRTGSAVAEKHAAAARQAAAVKRDATEPADKPAETHTDEEGRTFTRRDASDVWQLVPADKPAARKGPSKAAVDAAVAQLQAELTHPAMVAAISAVLEDDETAVRSARAKTAAKRAAKPAVAPSFPWTPADESSLIAQGYSRARVLVLTGQA